MDKIWLKLDELKLEIMRRFPILSTGDKVPITSDKLDSIDNKLPTTLGQKTKAGSLGVVLAIDSDALPITSIQLPASLGQKTKAQSVSIALASDTGTLPVQTDERPSDTHAAVVISDSVTLGTPCRGIYVGVGGDIVVYTGTSTTTFKNVPTGFILPVKATRVNATGTTASNLVWMF